RTPGGDTPGWYEKAPLALKRYEVRISTPMVGSRLINQISPLRMEWLAIQMREGGQFRVGGVIGKKRLGGLRQPIGALFYRALQLLAQLMHCGFDNLQPLRCGQLLQLLKDFSVGHGSRSCPTIESAHVRVQPLARLNSNLSFPRSNVWGRLFRCGRFLTANDLSQAAQRTVYGLRVRKRFGYVRV